MTKETFNIAKSIIEEIQKVETEMSKIRGMRIRHLDDEFNCILSVCHELLDLRKQYLETKFENLK